MIKFTNYLPMVGGSPASSTTKTGRHDIAEILLKVALNTKNHINLICCCLATGVLDIKVTKNETLF